VKEDGVYPLIHYILFGLKENRFQNHFEYNSYLQIKDKFDIDSYRNEYDDLKQVNDDFDLLLHYIRYGKSEGRKFFTLGTSAKQVKHETNLKEKEVDYLELIESSEYFDETFYLASNPDVANSKVNPIEHFLKYGWRERRNPSPLFDVNFYLNEYKDVDSANINPLIHYPVYNGFEFLEPLFNSIFKNTTLSYRLLICDDSSPDKKVFSYLKKIKELHHNTEIILLQNEVNLGFVKTVNRLVQYTNNHFVLLNTDTEVPPMWLERLMSPIFKMEKIATTTPFTNAGTICSFPNYLEDNATIINNM